MNLQSVKLCFARHCCALRLWTSAASIVACNGLRNRCMHMRWSLLSCWSCCAVHHKFAVLDSRMIANGSFNWTRQAVLFNQENVMLSDNPALVRPSAAVIRHDANFFVIRRQTIHYTASWVFWNAGPSFPLQRRRVCGRCVCLVVCSVRCNADGAPSAVGLSQVAQFCRQFEILWQKYYKR